MIDSAQPEPETVRGEEGAIYMDGEAALDDGCVPGSIEIIIIIVLVLLIVSALSCIREHLALLQ